MKINRTTVEADPKGAAAFLRSLKSKQASEFKPNETPDWFQIDREVDERLKRPSLWDNSSPVGRGVDYELLRGANISVTNPTHPVVDDVRAYEGIATSMKTMDLHDKTYTHFPQDIYRTGVGYVDDFFHDKSKDGINTKEGYKLPRYQIKGFHLEIGIPFGTTDEQREQLHRLQEYRREKGVRVIIAEVK